jgi:uncharacterized protein YutE (UPF0331/DUF86 family)
MSRDASPVPDRVVLAKVATIERCVARVRQVFALLAEAALVDRDLCARLERMVGFRNIAIHDYRALDLAIVDAVVRRHLGEFTEFGAVVLSLDLSSP